MSTLLTVKQVKSLTIGFTFPETYDTGRIEEIKVYLGKNVYPHTIDGRIVKCQIKSDDTAVMYGVNRLSFWLDDSIIGVYPVYCGDIVFEYTNAIEHNESINTLFDVMVNLTISETAITVDSVLYNILKGDKGDAFLYSDFTPEQIAELQQPASDAIASIEAVELSVEQAEALRVQAEIDRQTNTGTAIQNAETATKNASDAAILANSKATLANDAATNANTKAGLADTAVTNANTKAGLANTAATNADNARLAIQTDLGLKLDKTAVKQVTGASTTDVMSQKAVTDEFTQLAGEVNSFKSKEIALINGGGRYNNLSNKYIDGSGNILDINTRLLMPYISILVFESFSLNTNYKFNYYALYDKNLTFISSASILPMTSLFELKNIAIPQNAVYISMIIRNEAGTSILPTEDIGLSLIKKQDTLNLEISKIPAISTKLDNSILGSSNELILANTFHLKDVIGEYVNTVDGSFVENIYANRSNFMIAPVSIILTTGYSGSAIGIAFYEEANINTFISGVAYKAQTNYLITVPEKAKYFIASSTTATQTTLKCYYGIKSYTLPEVIPQTNLITKLNKPFTFGTRGVWFGASTTAGFSSTSQSIIANCYAKILSDKLGLTTYANVAVSGAKVYDTNNLGGGIYNQVMNFDTDVDAVFFNGGINDWAYQSPLGTINDNDLTTFCGCLNAICNRIKTRYPNAIVIFIQPQNVVFTPTASIHEFDEYREKIGQIAVIHGFSSIAGDAVYMPNRLGDFYNTMLSDGLHPTDLGHQYYGEGLAGIIL